MRYEIAHDTLAKHIHSSASEETKVRRRMQSHLQRWVERYRERQVLLTKDELAQLAPFRSILRIILVRFLDNFTSEVPRP